jgi:hypothetical protein
MRNLSLASEARLGVGAIADDGYEKAARVLEQFEAEQTSIVLAQIQREFVLGRYDLAHCRATEHHRRDHDPDPAASASASDTATSPLARSAG